MCGGQGSRLESEVEKPLYSIAGVPMVDRVCGALADSTVESIYAVVSPQAPETQAHLARSETVHTIETPGSGYVSDLQTALGDARLSTPVLTVAADLPLLEAATVDRICERYARQAGGGSMTVCVPVARKRQLGVSVDTTVFGAPHLAPTGLNIVGGKTEMKAIQYDSRLAVNVNRLEDARRARALLSAPDTAESALEDRCD